MQTPASVEWSSDLLYIDGEQPAATALKKILSSTAHWVVIRRRGTPYLYAFTPDEVRARLGRLAPRTDLDANDLAAVLDLHEHHQSTVLADRLAPPAIDVSWRPDRSQDLPSVWRYVLRSQPGGLPTAVGGAGVEPRQATHRSSKLPQEYQWLRPFGPLPRGVAQPALAESPAESEPSLPADEGSTPVRYPAIEPDAPPAPGRPIALTVDLLQHPDAATASGALRLAALPADWTALPLAVNLICSGIDFDDGGAGTVTIRRNRASLPARITGRVRGALLPGALLDVKAIFYAGNRFCGDALRQLTVVPAPPAQTAPSPPATPPPGNRQETPQGPAAAGPGTLATVGTVGTVGMVAVEYAAQEPDLTVYISLQDPSSPGQLRWQLRTTRFDGLPPRLDGYADLGRDTAAEAAALFAQFAALERGKHMDRINGFGGQLWNRTPAVFRDAYWAIWDHYRRPLTIQFLTAEPHLPWELVRPTRGDESETHPPLARMHSVARWLLRYDGWMPNQLPGGGLFTIAPHYPSAARGLQRAEAESAGLVTQFGATRVAGTTAAVRALLENSSPGQPVAVLHFAGHGSFAASTADNSTIDLEDGVLAVSEVARTEVRLGKACRTLVFFNACEVGATGSALGTVGGWADAFLGRQFGGFIAPLWAVDDQDAATVSSDLMAGILTRREPVGAVLSAIRDKYGDVSPTFYSYLYFGDVTARLAPPPAAAPADTAPAAGTSAATRP